jgi:uncharacterized protein YpmS
MSEFPWGVFILLSCGLAFTAYIIYYILKLAHEEMNDETSKSDSINHQSKH